MMSNLNELVLSSRQILSPENSQRISQTLTNLEAISGSFARQDTDIPMLIKELTRASQLAQTTLQKTTALLEHADKLIRGNGAKNLASARKKTATQARSTAKMTKKHKKKQTN